jgi:hypothetical protein
MERLLVYLNIRVFTGVSSTYQLAKMGGNCLNYPGWDYG